MAWLYKQPGSKNWWIGYRLNGRQYLRSTGTEKREDAELELARLDQIGLAHKSGNLTEEFFRLITNTAGSNETLRGFVRRWLAECKDLSSVTLTRYTDALEEFCKHLNATDASPMLREVRPEAIAGFIRHKRATTSTATARLYRKIVSAFFSYAVDNQVLPINPVPRAKTLKLTKDSEAVRRAFTLKELKTLFSKAPNDFWRWMILAGFYMGQRMGDLICIPWGAIDFQQGLVRLKARKTGRTLQIPLRSELRTFLLKLRANAGNPKPSDPLWPEECARYEKTGAAVFSNQFYDDVLLPAGLVVKRSKNAAMDEQGNKIVKQGRQVNEVSFHCLRHTFVSLLKISGGSQAVAKELAGHNSDAVSDLYTHVPEEALTKAIEKLPEMLSAAKCTIVR